MCIAIISENGVSLPKKTVLKRCFEKNPDGAGYAVLLSTNEWECKKGFMTFKSFWKSFNREQYTNEDTVIIHFRIGTSGKKIEKKNAHPDCTHPFPITSNEEELMAHSFIAKNIMMHNGVCGSGRGDLSDTMVAIVDYIDPLLPHIEDKKMLNILHKCLGTTNRWFIAKENNSWMLGDWEEDKETGIFYSNRGYLPEKKYEPYTYDGRTSHWYNYGTGWKKEDPVIANTGASKAMYYVDGKWSWEKWGRLNTPLLAAPQQKKEGNFKTYEVFNEKNELTTIIDADGSVVWEKDKDDDVVDFDCPYCTNSINFEVLSDEGECPFCYEQVWHVINDADYIYENATLKDDLTYKCPNCGEEDYLIEPLHNIGDTECCKCGAIFNDNSDAIIGWAFKKAIGGGAR